MEGFITHDRDHVKANYL